MREYCQEDRAGTSIEWEKHGKLIIPTVYVPADNAEVRFDPLHEEPWEAFYFNQTLPNAVGRGKELSAAVLQMYEKLVPLLQYRAEEARVLEKEAVEKSKRLRAKTVG